MATSWTQTTAANRAVSYAKSMVGKGGNLVGMCEKFTRTCFGFSAKYGSANLAYQASKAAGGLVAGNGADAPAGSVMFWDITTGKNTPYDHVAPVVAKGVVASTSAGPGSTVAKVKITDLTKRWGMKPRGWAYIYHGQSILTPKGSSSGSSSGTGGGAGASNKYPNENVTSKLAELKSGWWRLLGALGYSGDTWTRVQKWLTRSGHYAGRVDGDLGPMTITAMQRRLKQAWLKNKTKLTNPGPADGKRGSKTRAAEAAYLNHQRNQASK